MKLKYKKISSIWVLTLILMFTNPYIVLGNPENIISDGLKFKTMNSTTMKNRLQTANYTSVANISFSGPKVVYQNQSLQVYIDITDIFTGEYINGTLKFYSIDTPFDPPKQISTGKWLLNATKRQTENMYPKNTTFAVEISPFNQSIAPKFKNYYFLVKSNDIILPQISLDLNLTYYPGAMLAAPNVPYNLTITDNKFIRLATVSYWFKDQLIYNSLFSPASKVLSRSLVTPNEFPENNVTVKVSVRDFGYNNVTITKTRPPIDVQGPTVDYFSVDENTLYKVGDKIDVNWTGTDNTAVKNAFIQIDDNDPLVFAADAGYASISLPAHPLYINWTLTFYLVDVYGSFSNSIVKVIREAVHSPLSSGTVNSDISSIILIVSSFVTIIGIYIIWYYRKKLNEYFKRTK